VNAYECYGKFRKDGYIDIPLDIKKKLKSNQRIKLVIMIEDEDEKNEKIKALEGLNGLLSDLNGEKIKEFDEVINERVNFHRIGLKA